MIEVLLAVALALVLRVLLFGTSAFVLAMLVGGLRGRPPEARP
jgi:hypothetical protein